MHGKNASLLPINCDSQGARSHITTEIRAVHTKHLDIGYHNCVIWSVCNIANDYYMYTNETVTDLLTEAILNEQYEELANWMEVW